MLENICKPEPREETMYRIVFEDGVNSGFAFPCDEHGQVFPNLPRCRKAESGMVSATP